MVGGINHPASHSSMIGLVSADVSLSTKETKAFIIPDSSSSVSLVSADFKFRPDNPSLSNPNIYGSYFGGVAGYDALPLLPVAPTPAPNQLADQDSLTDYSYTWFDPGFRGGGEGRYNTVPLEEAGLDPKAYPGHAGVMDGRDYLKQKSFIESWTFGPGRHKDEFFIIGDAFAKRKLSNDIEPPYMRPDHERAKGQFFCAKWGTPASFFQFGISNFLSTRCIDPIYYTLRKIAGGTEPWASSVGQHPDLHCTMWVQPNTAWSLGDEIEQNQDKLGIPDDDHFHVLGGPPPYYGGHAGDHRFHTNIYGELSAHKIGMEYKRAYTTPCFAIGRGGSNGITLNIEDDNKPNWNTLQHAYSAMLDGLNIIDTRLGGGNTLSAIQQYTEPVNIWINDDGIKRMVNDFITQAARLGGLSTYGYESIDQALDNLFGRLNKKYWSNSINYPALKKSLSDATQYDLNKDETLWENNNFRYIYAAIKGAPELLFHFTDPMLYLDHGNTKDFISPVMWPAVSTYNQHLSTTSTGFDDTLLWGVSSGGSHLTLRYHDRIINESPTKIYGREWTNVGFFIKPILGRELIDQRRGGETTDDEHTATKPLIPNYDNDMCTIAAHFDRFRDINTGIMPMGGEDDTDPTHYTSNWIYLIDSDERINDFHSKDVYNNVSVGDYLYWKGWDGGSDCPRYQQSCYVWATVRSIQTLQVSEFNVSSKYNVKKILLGNITRGEEGVPSTPEEAWTGSSGYNTLIGNLINDGDCTGHAGHFEDSVAGASFNFDTGYDTGDASNAKAYRDIMICQGSSGAVGTFAIEYSDDNVSWTAPNASPQDPNPATISTSPAGYGSSYPIKLHASWEDAGAHRYWRIRITEDWPSAPWIDEVAWGVKAGAEPVYKDGVPIDTVWGYGGFKLDQGHEVCLQKGAVVPPSVEKGGLLVFQNKWNAPVAVNRKNGKLMWIGKQPPGYQLYTTGNTVDRYYSDYEPDEYTTYAPKPIHHNGTIITMGFYKHATVICCTDVSTGVKKWEYKVPNVLSMETVRGGLSLMPGGGEKQIGKRDGGILIFAADTKVYAVNAHDGTLAWTYDGKVNFHAQYICGIVPPCFTMYTIDGKQPGDGWSANTKMLSKIELAPVVIEHQHIQQHYIYCFTQPCPQPAPTVTKTYRVYMLCKFRRAQGKEAHSFLSLNERGEDPRWHGELPLDKFGGLMTSKAALPPKSIGNGAVIFPTATTNNVWGGLVTCTPGEQSSDSDSNFKTFKKIANFNVNETYVSDLVDGHVYAVHQHQPTGPPGSVVYKRAPGDLWGGMHVSKFPINPPDADNYNTAVWTQVVETSRPMVNGLHRASASTGNQPGVEPAVSKKHNRIYVRCHESREFEVFSTSGQWLYGGPRQTWDMMKGYGGRGSPNPPGLNIHKPGWLSQCGLLGGVIDEDNNQVIWYATLDNKLHVTADWMTWSYWDGSGYRVLGGPEGSLGPHPVKWRTPSLGDYNEFVLDGSVLT